MDEKSRELTHSNRELSAFEGESDWSEDPEAEVNQNIEQLWEAPDPHAEFEEALVRDVSFAAALPKLLKILTPREREIFACLRENQQNCEIAKTLTISEARVSQLVKQVTLKLTNAGQNLGLRE